MIHSKKFLKIYKNKKVLITGSTGFKGAWLCFWLHLLKAKVIGIGLKPEKGSKIFSSLKLTNKIKQYYTNINDFDRLNAIIKKHRPNIIFHLAAQSVVLKSFKNPLETIETNVIGSSNILECVRLNKIKNIIYVTSDKCYLNVEKNRGYKETDVLGGKDNYSASKAAAEIIFNSYYNSFFKSDKINQASVRAGNVIGGGDFKSNRIVPDIIKSLYKNNKLILRNPNATRPWQHVLEPLAGYLFLGSKLLKNEISSRILPHWNFGPYSHNSKSVMYIFKLVSRIWGKKKINLKLKKISNKKNQNYLV